MITPVSPLPTRLIYIILSQRRSQGGCWRGSSTHLSDQNIDVYFLVFHQHCTVSRDQVHCKMFFGSTTGVATHSLSNQAIMNFRDLRNIEAAFFIPACFALPYITRAGCCHALPVWKQAWHLNYQQCRLMCSFYVTKLGTFLMYTRGWYASVLPLLMFWEKGLTSDVLAANLMLTEQLFLSPNFISL